MRPVVRALPSVAVCLTAAVAPASAGTPLPPIRTPTDADITFAETARATTLDSKGRFTFRFGARAGTTGSVTFATPKRVLKLGKKPFRVADDGTSAVTFKLTGADADALRSRTSVRVTATVTSTAGEKGKRSFTLKAPRR